MENIAFQWRPCRSCKNGRVALFTSVVACDECSGTGVDLSDDRLDTNLESLLTMVRTRKFLHRFGVDTVRQLLCVMASGRLADCDINSFVASTFLLDIRNLLLKSGLRAREDGVLEDVRPRSGASIIAMANPAGAPDTRRPLPFAESRAVGMIKRIISRGVCGPELAALFAAQDRGLSTGGHTRVKPDVGFEPIIRRFCLTADGCNLADSVLRNANEADGTLIFGPLDACIAALVRGTDKPVYETGTNGRPDFQNVLSFAAWTRENAIGTLNVMGPGDKRLERPARVFILEAMRELRALGKGDNP